ncbi:MaoC/PaaZ C-terminal domain-containing protein [Massilia sp. 9I]|uniref:MaoC/PaaZ C-terminal domain-containing protein n=1 Tax=Massilia sp. 9I TaxID=2653152 RepID=UPI0012EF83D1|nr:MaoC/PaaZ C-terminal domain-containing protein [Massilia sp. 9I]VXC70999.1 hypothetical protein MASSI9I_90409 [Massilia sp. 9I]
MDNALEEHGHVASGQPLLIRTVLRLLPPASSGALRCELETTGTADGMPVFRCASTYLIRRGARSSAKPAQPEIPSIGIPIARWVLDTAAGRRYARLSCDWNPIHLFGWSARLMGMRAPIIHGMHTLAASCAAIERDRDRHVTRIECRFRAPVALGSSLTLRAGQDGDFVVEFADKAAVTGNCSLS